MSYVFKTVPCPSGGIGRRTGLKILRVLKLVPVQVRPWAPNVY